MSQTMSVRAASLATSAALLAIVVIGAFSVTITLQSNSTEQPWTIPVFQLPPDPPPPEPTRQEDPPPQPIRHDDVIATVDPPLAPPIEGPGTLTDLLPPVSPLAEITNPRWVRQPRDLARYYPARALAREQAGSVLLNCRVDVGGALHCAVVSETPAGWGFGDAALRIAQDYRMVPAMRDGVAVEGRYRMRVPFEVR